MNYFTAGDILFSILTTLIYGFVFGMLYKSLQEILFIFKRLITLIPCAIIICDQIPISGIKKHLKSKNNITKLSVSRHILDFLYFSCFGITLILINYVTLDGVVRLYIPLIAIISFITANLTLGDLASKILYKVFNKIYLALFIACSIVFRYPVKLFKILLEKVKLKYLTFNKKINARRSKKLIEKKINEIKNVSKVKFNGKG